MAKASHSYAWSTSLQRHRDQLCHDLRMEQAETPLSDGGTSVSGSTLIGGEVHRSRGPWTSAVHRLLRYLEEVGFAGAPRVVGFDDKGREILTFVEGDTASRPWPSWMMTDEALAGLGRLLREYHDAVSNFVAPAGAQWRRWVGAEGGTLIRHGDLWPSNVVFRAGVPVALIDWDFAQPGTRLDDLVSAAKHWIPLMSDDRAGAEGWALPLDRPKRLRVLCDAYGLEPQARSVLLPTAIRNAQWGYASHKDWGEAGVAGFAEMWRKGSGTLILGDLTWLENARPDLEMFLGSS